MEEANTKYNVAKDNLDSANQITPTVVNALLRLTQHPSCTDTTKRVAIKKITETLRWQLDIKFEFDQADMIIQDLDPNISDEKKQENHKRVEEFKEELAQIESEE